MLKISLIFCTIGLVVSCGSPETKKPEEEIEAGTEAPVEVRNLYQEYEDYLASLHLKNEQSVTLAAEKYIELFSKSDEQLCDSAFILFDGFYRGMENKLNDQIMNDLSYQEFPCITYDSLGVKEEPFDKRFVPFRKSIERNGFRIECPEGMTQIAQNRIFLKKYFYGLVSPLMKEFLEGVRRERDEQFTYDAGIVISAKAYVDRLVWWDEFNTKHPDFILSKKANANQIYLFTYFLNGMDNTPVMNIQEDGNGAEKMELDPYFEEAYAYLNKKYPNSPVNALVKPYKMTILKNDRAKRERLIKTYTKRGLMIDYSRDFDWDLL